MRLSSLCLAFASMFILSSLSHLVVADSLQSYTPPCHDDEISALLQFKQSFDINMSASDYEGAYPKTSSWKSNSNCCSWDGVECNEETRHVIGLNLSSSCLYGSINSNSTLFRLVHLESLNLADNDFVSSQIPPTIRNFSKLRYLNLSYSVFSGQVPSEVSQLTKLSSLDISDNDEMFSNKGFLRSLDQNLTGLEKLHLSSIFISSRVPNTMANLSFLTSLHLDSCDLLGQFPGRIFKLQNLKVLSVAYNYRLTGYFPDDYNGSSPDLMSLELSETNFFINMPFLIEKFGSLKELDVSWCNISEGPIPFSLGNLRNLIYLDLSFNEFNGQIPSSFANLRNLIYLDLSFNKFNGQIPSSFANLTQLTYFSLEGNQINGTIPCSFEYLTQLATLHLDRNQLSGPIPSCLSNLGKLTVLDLSFNKFQREIPESLFNVASLKRLFLAYNNLSGTVEFLKFLKLPNLKWVDLSGNNLDVITETRTMNASSIARLKYLDLGSCNISEFPNFLRYQDTLKYLNLSWNGMHGQVPKWMWNTSRESLVYLDISHNLLSGFEQPPVVLPWVKLDGLDLSFNRLSGPLLVPSLQGIRFYRISNNKLTGEISPLICNASSLYSLDVSNNSLSGMLPRCLENSSSLGVLSAGYNYFHGTLPHLCPTNGSELVLIDVSHNQLQGKLPRSLANCSWLKSLVLSSNKFDDVFPVWLGTLPELKILAMRNSGFHGAISRHQSNHDGFPNLRILDLSQNNFTGQFAFEFILSGKPMRGIHLNESEYMAALEFGIEFAAYVEVIGMHFAFSIYEPSITLMNKGSERYFQKIPEDFMAIDLSSNRFEGKIPEFIGNLKGLRSLNVSSNILSGRIPPSLGNLTNLDALDLSHNNFLGEIPPSLLHLSSLQIFSVSHNNLKGQIPVGNQFNTFDNTSYEGNPGLCGFPLPKKCSRPEGPELPPSTAEEEDGVELGWKFAAAGLVSGLVVGVVLADFVITRFSERFIEIVALLNRLMKGMRRPRS